MYVADATFARLQSGGRTFDVGLSAASLLNENGTTAGRMDLHLVGNRTTLAIVEFGATPVPAVARLKISNDYLTAPVYSEFARFKTCDSHACVFF